MKVCAKCNKTKSETAFYKKPTSCDGLHSSCKLCQKEKSQKYYQKNKDKIIRATLTWRFNNKERCRENNRKWQEKNKEKCRLVRRKSLCKRYGIKIEDYNEMFLEQNGVCAICERKETSRLRGILGNLNIDHDHTTGKIRGLLCLRCNQVLGRVNDDVGILTKMVDYLGN